MRLVRQPVASLEQKLAVERERHANRFFDDRKKNPVEEDERGRVDAVWRALPRGAFGGVAKRAAPSRDDQPAEEQRRQNDRDDARLTFQPVVAGGSVLVHLMV